VHSVRTINSVPIRYRVTNKQVNPMGNKKAVTVAVAAMQNGPVITLAGTTMVTTPPPPFTTVYTVLAPKGRLHEKTRYGTGGTAGTHAALAAAAAANGGTLTAAQAVAVCIAQGDRGFFGYAVRRLKVLQPVTPA
jgi:hypothetical protein